MSSEPISSALPVLSAEEWRHERECYWSRIRPWAEDRLERMARGRKHPVYDFLFEYYSFRPAHLLRWTPGCGVRLAQATDQDVAWSEFVACDSGLLLPPQSYPVWRKGYLVWALNYLQATQEREPSFKCLGLHEWAMVYRSPEIRHSHVPLRLSREETDAVVESLAIRCTHYDAFRFFTPQALPRNRWELSRSTTADHDQSGCLHVNMDLYRFAYKIAPFCPSTIVADAFELARAAREIDMRASPYDLSRLGFTPIQIETPEGRTEYVRLQAELRLKGQPIRQRLLEVYSLLAKSVSDTQVNIDKSLAATQN